jgi:hypothetical protein
MEKKTIKFRDHLAKLILAGEKNLTWRLFDDKNLSEGDQVDFINWNTKEKFGEAVLTKVWEKKMSNLEDSDFDGHEKFSSDEEMYKIYRAYYGDKVGPDTIVKIIRFRLK